MPSIDQITNEAEKKSLSASDLLDDPSKIDPAWYDLLPTPRGLMSFADLPDRPENNLLGNYWLERGGSASIFGLSGTGKSSSVYQAACQWSQGRPAFGIQPAHANLTITIIQVEDSDRAIKVPMAGVRKAMEYTEEECAHIDANVYVHRTTHTGEELFRRTILPILAVEKPDILILNPIMSLVSSNISNQEEANFLFRNLCAKMLAKFHIGLIIVNHTPKPGNTDFSKLNRYNVQYLQIGHSDVTNWVRSILAILPTNKEDVFEFIAAKNGAAIGWKAPISTHENDGEEQKHRPLYNRYFKHNREGESMVWWTEADFDEIKEAKCNSKGQMSALKFKDLLEHGRTYSTQELMAIAELNISAKTPEALQKACARVIKSACQLNFLVREARGLYKAELRG